MTKLEVSSNQRNLTNKNAVKLCERLSGLAAQAFPEKITGSRVYLTTGGGEGIEAAYHLALRYWNKSGPLGTSYGGGYKKQKLISFRNCYHGSTFVSASMKPEFSDYGWKRWMEGHERDVYESSSHRMFCNIDPPHELFFERSKLKHGESVGQAAGKWCFHVNPLDMLLMPEQHGNWRNEFSKKALIPLPLSCLSPFKATMALSTCTATSSHLRSGFAESTAS